MTNRRVYELARELGVPTGEVLAIAEELGFEGLVAVSGLDEDRAKQISAVVHPVKRRVYELARELDAPTRDILAIAIVLGHEKLVAVSGLDADLAEGIVEGWNASRAPV